MILNCLSFDTDDTRSLPTDNTIDVPGSGLVWTAALYWTEACPG
ncbi:unnamed protein product [Ixodes pacificus]